MCPWFNLIIGTHAWMLKTVGLEICVFLRCPINFRGKGRIFLLFSFFRDSFQPMKKKEKRFWMNFLWSYLFETGTDRAEILHSCQTRGTEQLLPWSKRKLPLKKSEIPWFAVVLSARARPALQSWGPQALTQKGDGGSSRWRARFYFWPFILSKLTSPSDPTLRYSRWNRICERVRRQK